MYFSLIGVMPLRLTCRYVGVGHVIRQLPSHRVYQRVVSEQRWEHTQARALPSRCGPARPARAGAFLSRFPHGPWPLPGARLFLV